MKRIALFLLLLLLPGACHAQDIIDATHLLKMDNMRLNAENMQSPGIRATLAQANSIRLSGNSEGDTILLWTANFTDYLPPNYPVYYQQVNFTMNESQETYEIYVETSRLGSISAGAMENISRELNLTIYPTDSSVFGDPPDYDSDGKVHLLMYDIVDLPGSTILGYFNSRDQSGVSYSNQADVIYLDINPTTPGSEDFYGVTAHELQHLIHYGLDPDEESWLNEGFAEYSYLACGYGVTGTLATHLNSFKSSPDNSLTNWGSTNADYGVSFAFAEYLFEKYGGNETLWNITHESGNGVSGINSVLSAKGYTQQFADVFKDWVVANYLDNTTIEGGKFGYHNVSMSVSSTSVSSYPASGSGSTNQWAADYFVFSSQSKNLVVDIDGDDADGYAGQLVVGNGGYTFYNFTLNSTNGGWLAVMNAADYNDIALIFSDNGTSGGTSYTYSARLDSNPAVLNVTQESVLASGVNQTIVINVTDDVGVDAVLVEISGTNYSATESGSLFNHSWLPVGNGTHNYTVHVNDTIGSWNSSNFTFVMDTSTPSIWNATINSTTIYDSDGVRIQVNVSDESTDTVLASHNASGAWMNYTTTRLGLNDTWYYDINSGLLENGERVGWQFFVNDSIGNWNYTSVQSFTVQNRLPGAPQLVAVDIYITASTVTFNWTAVNDSDADNITYSFALSLEDSFNSTVANGTFNSTNYTATGLSDGQYFWRVNASDGQGGVNSSEIGNFTVTLLAPVFNKVWATPSLATNNSVVVVWANLTVFNRTTASLVANSSLGGVLLSYSSGLWNGTLDVNQTGPFNITFNATDIVNRSAVNTTPLRVGAPVIISYNVSTSGGANENVTVEFIDPETNQTLGTNTSAEANVTQAGADRLDVKVFDKVSNVSVIIPINSSLGVVLRVTFERVTTSEVGDVPSNNAAQGVQTISPNITLAANATVSFNYDASGISDADAENLRIYKCTSYSSGSCTGSWELLSVARDTDANTISVNVAGFSTFMLTLYSAPVVQSSSGGGGASGATITATAYERMRLDKIEEGMLGTFRFKRGSSVITEIGVQAKKEMENPSITITNLGDDNPLSKIPKGEVYTYLEVEKSFEDPDISRVFITFKVKKGALEEKDVDVVLRQFTSRWKKLDTEKVREDEEYAYFSASTDKFSYFVVVFEEAKKVQPEVVVEDEPAAPVEAEQVEKEPAEGEGTAEEGPAGPEGPEEAPKLPGVDWALVVLLVVGAVWLIYKSAPHTYFRRKKH